MIKTVKACKTPEQVKCPFTWTTYKGKPAVFDTVSRVFYTGYKTMQAARQHAEQLNRGE